MRAFSSSAVIDLHGNTTIFGSGCALLNKGRCGNVKSVELLSFLRSLKRIHGP